VPAGLGIVAVVLALMVGLALAIGEDDGAELPPVASLATIAKRVETVRGLRFEHVPAALHVSPEKAREEGLADLDRGYPAAARKADETVYAMLGLVPKGTDLKKISASLFGEQVAGYYDPRTGRLRVVDGAATGNRVLTEITLAHELDHALEDQAFPLDTDQSEDTGDAGYAYRALVEGSATVVMLEYARRYFEPGEALGGILASAFAVSSTTPLPPFIEASFTWPYLGGQAFINRLYEAGGGSWRLVDLALETRPPASTEQILHPEKWLAVEQPLPVAFDLALGKGFQMRTEGTFGEWQTAQLVGSPGPAAGWGGDHYELWARGEEQALAMRWRWDTPQDAREFEEVLREIGWPDGVTAEIENADGEIRLLIRA
jgi:hypothetical protein